MIFASYILLSLVPSIRSMEIEISPVPQKTQPTLETGKTTANPRAEDLKKIKVSVDRALSYLAKKQSEEPDGCFPQADAKQYAPIGVSSLCALAFLGGGNAGHGPYAENAVKAIDYLLSKSETLDPKTLGYIHADNDPHSKMHGHGYAALAFAEAYGMYEIKRGKEAGEKLRNALIAAVQRIEVSQGESGGWYYNPYREISHEGSVTIVLVQALRAARNVGIQVDKNVIDRAVVYVRKLQKENGSFRYQLGKEDSSAALTAAGIATLNATGEYDGPAIAQGIDFLFRNSQQKYAFRKSMATEAFPEYGRLYTAQALYQYRDRKLWEEWFAATQEELLSTQREDGSWEASEFGSIYVTAVNCLVLEIAFDYLPIFQR